MDWTIRRDLSPYPPIYARACSNRLKFPRVLSLLFSSNMIFHGFLEHFDGTTLAIIHEEDDMADKHADLVIYAQPKDAFKELGYHMQ